MSIPKSKARSVDLGQLQNEMEAASRQLKAANTILNKAQDAQNSAEGNYHSACKALAAGVLQLTAATKVV